MLFPMALRPANRVAQGNSLSGAHLIRLLTGRMCPEKRYISILGLEDLVGALVVVRTFRTVRSIHTAALCKERKRCARTFRSTRRRKAGLARTGRHFRVDCDCVRPRDGRVGTLHDIALCKRPSGVAVRGVAIDCSVALSVDKVGFVVDEFLGLLGLLFGG